MPADYQAEETFEILNTYAVHCLDLPDYDIDSVGPVPLNYSAPVPPGAMFDFTDNVLVDFHRRVRWDVIAPWVAAYRAALAANGGPPPASYRDRPAPGGPA
jgi:hypothetical protein